MRVAPHPLTPTKKPRVKQPLAISTFHHMTIENPHQHAQALGQEPTAAERLYREGLRMRVSICPPASRLRCSVRSINWSA